MRKLTLSDLQAAAKLRGGACLTSEYVNAHTPVRWRCARGHEWESRATNVLHAHSWCPYCAGRRHDLDEMRLAASARGGECLSKRYLGMRAKLRWRCAHGHEWETTPATVLNAGAWCPECSTGLGERLARSALEQIMGVPFPKARPPWLVSRRGTQLELDGYSEQLGVAFEHQGEQHYQPTAYYAEPSVFERRLEDDNTKRELCRANKVALIEIPEVGRRLQLKSLAAYVEDQLTLAGVRVFAPGISPDYNRAYASNGGAEALERLKRQSAELDGECLETHYMGSHVRHRFRCAQGHEWLTPADSVFRGKWCPYCSAARKAADTKNPIERIQLAAHDRGGRLVSTEYISSAQPLLWECADGHQWSAPYNRIRDGKWCPTCARRSISEFETIARSRGGRLVSAEYLGMAKPLEWECRMGHRWHARPLNIVNGTWCPHCAGNRQLTLDDMRDLAAARGGLCLSQQYQNARSKLRWRCSRGHEWEAAPHSIRAGTWCPTCAKMQQQHGGSNKR